jgi:hypothetical protein
VNLKKELLDKLKSFAVVDEDGKSQPVCAVYADWGQVETLVKSPRQKDSTFEGFTPSCFTHCFLSGGASNYGYGFAIKFEGSLMTKSLEARGQLIDQLLNVVGVPNREEEIAGSHWRVASLDVADMLMDYHVTTFQVWHVLKKTS